MGDFLYICVMENNVLYIHTRKSDGIIFYVGIGVPERPYDNNHRNRAWKYCVKKHGHNVHVLCENLSWERACELEVFMIAFYGRKDKKQGRLLNLTDGGEGTKGAIRSEDHKKKISMANTGKIVGEETRKKISKLHKGKVMSPESRKKMRDAQLGDKNPFYGKTHKRESLVKQCKLTDDQVLEIRRTYKPRDEKYGQKPMADKYGVAGVTISRIVRGLAWAHLS